MVSSRTSDSPRLRPPPNYASRRVQLRVMLLVAVLMTVVLMMEKAADPRTWAWMWSGTPAVSGAVAGSTARPATAQPPPPASPDPALPDAFQTGARYGSPTGQISPEDESLQLQILLDAWREIWGKLPESHAQRCERVLRADRRSQPLPAVDQQDWTETVALLDELWQGYVDHASAALADLPPPARAAWEQRLQVARESWTSKQRPALAALAASPVDPAFRPALDHVQSLLRRLAFEQVEDDTPLRRRESRAWVRVLDELQPESTANRSPHTAEATSYLELFRQPEVYRGRRVAVHGRARLGYSVAAPSDDDQQRRLYVLWIKPIAGPNAPLAVYCEALPVGFPPLADGDQGNETALDEPVALEAVFFKRFAYPARQGIQTAPLLLARQPQWSPAAAATTPALPSPRTVVMSILGVLAGSCLLAWSVHRATSARHQRRDSEPPTPKHWNQLRDLPKHDARPGPPTPKHE